MQHFSAADRKPGHLIRFLVKLGISGLLLGWLGMKGGFDRIAGCLAQVSLPWFALAVGTYLLGQSLCAWKWSVLAAVQRFDQPFRFYWLNYLAGMFFSLFLPTTIGGDAYRTLALSHQNGDRTGALVTVLADRGTGVLAMAWIAAAAVSVWPPPGPLRPAIQLTALALTAGFLLPFVVRPPWAGKGFLARVLACWDHPRELWTSVGAALLFQGLAVVVYVELAMALHLPLHLGFYAVLSPVVALAAMLPLTVNGLGVREWTLAAFFPQIGASVEQAVAFGLAWAAMAMVASLGGAIVLPAAGGAASAVSELPRRRRPASNRERASGNG